MRNMDGIGDDPRAAQGPYLTLIFSFKTLRQAQCFDALDSVPVLVSSSMWFLAVISMALAVNWEALVRHYRAWQRQHGVFTLTGREAGRRDVEPV
ncbi:hypothetical protein AK812_SmicGene28622 [Symbiodinium microadriaticum]|uniref:Uncharacterized protein n=1 Tax=Symbiodinium microadriaticum TaxID=2951 RepID=A0A1Q9D3Y8_SYMMI|nr:hypothetical protein AK812_SmicGene28622 [Symbiodinium microadriaticum]